MAHNPKLNVYIIELKKKGNKEDASFFDFYNILSNNKFEYSDTSDTYSFFTETFVDFLGGKDKFSKDQDVKKVFGLSKTNEKLNLNVNTDEFILSGILEGGKYGIKREAADVSNKSKRNEIPEDVAILDKFYFLMKTPLDSKYGTLIVQSYTEETILQPFVDKIKNYYGWGEQYFKPNLELFVPAKFIDKFKQESLVRGFQYSSTFQMEEKYNSTLGLDSHDFEVTVTLKPKKDIEPSNKNLEAIKKYLGGLIFNKHSLKEFPKGKVFIKDDGGKQANFDIEKELSSIKPTIYLNETNVEINENGVPEFKSLHKYCLDLVIEIEENINRNINL